jgi:hypothetical protein
MDKSNGKSEALHVATMSGWYRFEKRAGEWRQAGRALSYWSLTCLSVDPENPALVYAGSEHSGLFYTTDGGARWERAKPNVPKMMLFSVLALPGTVLAGTIPAAVYKKNGGGWEELEGVRRASGGASFPPSPELQSRTRYLAADPAVPGAGSRRDRGRRPACLRRRRQKLAPGNEGLTDRRTVLPAKQTAGPGPRRLRRQGLRAATAPPIGKRSRRRATTTACRWRKMRKDRLPGHAGASEHVAEGVGRERGDFGAATRLALGDRRRGFERRRHEHAPRPAAASSPARPTATSSRSTRPRA